MYIIYRYIYIYILRGRLQHTEDYGTVHMYNQKSRQHSRLDRQSNEQDIVEINRDIHLAYTLF